MKAVINLEDPVGKTVGRRAVPSDSLRYGLGLQKSLAAIHRGFPVRPGVYRFDSFEEADEWMMNLMVRGKVS